MKENFVSGALFAVPLFLYLELDNLKRYKKKLHQTTDGLYVPIRLIKDLQGSGLLIEVFDTPQSYQNVMNSPKLEKRLFRPISTFGLAMTKGRWPFIGIEAGYDPIRDSDYESITQVLNPADPHLWQNGKSWRISREEAKQHEWATVWQETRLESRIRWALGMDEFAYFAVEDMYQELPADHPRMRLAIENNKKWLEYFKLERARWQPRSKNKRQEDIIDPLVYTIEIPVSMEPKERHTSVEDPLIELLSEGSGELLGGGTMIHEGKPIGSDVQVRRHEDIDQSQFMERPSRMQWPAGSLVKQGSTVLKML